MGLYPSYHELSLPGNCSPFCQAPWFIGYSLGDCPFMGLYPSHHELSFPGDSHPILSGAQIAAAGAAGEPSPLAVPYHDSIIE